MIPCPHHHRHYRHYRHRHHRHRTQWLGNAFVLDGAPCGKAQLRSLKEQTATYITAKPEFREKALTEQRGDVARRRRVLEDDDFERLGATIDRREDSLADLGQQTELMGRLTEQGSVDYTGRLVSHDGRSCTQGGSASGRSASGTTAKSGSSEGGPGRLPAGILRPSTDPSMGSGSGYGDTGPSTGAGSRTGTGSRSRTGTGSRSRSRTGTASGSGGTRTGMGSVEFSQFDGSSTRSGGGSRGGSGGGPATASVTVDDSVETSMPTDSVEDAEASETRAYGGCAIDICPSPISRQPSSVGHQPSPNP